MSHRKALIKLIEANGYKHSHWQVFSDFVELAALSISNAVDLARREAREARTMTADTIGKDILSAIVMELKLLPKPWPKLSEAKQNDIIAASFRGEAVEWRDTGTGLICTAFVPAGEKVPERCPLTVDMFEPVPNA